MMKLSALVLLLAAAQAQIASLLSTQVSNVAGSVEVSVTFTECVQGVDASSFRFFPASTQVLNGECTEVIANQQFSCSWDLGSTESALFSVDLPAASVTGVSGGSNTKSNKVSIQSFAPIQTDFFTKPNQPVVRTSPISFYWSPTNPVTYTNIADPFEVNTDGSSGDIISIDISESLWTVTVEANDGDSITVSLKAGAAVDAAGQTNAGGESITRVLSQDVQDCVVSNFGSFSPCSATCTSYSADFQPLAGFRSRSRTIVTQPDEKGTLCPELVETVPCEASNTRCDGGSRPFSAENGQECSNNCAAVNPRTGDLPAGRSNQEESGCFCDQRCEEAGDCCQGYYTNNCCIAGSNCATREELQDFIFKGDFPTVCSRNVCRLSRAIFRSSNPSYYCYCDTSCREDFSCCSGTASRDQVCN